MTFQPRSSAGRGSIIALRAAALVLGAVVAGAGALPQARAGDEDRDRPVATPRRVAIENGQSVVKLDPATQQRSGIETAPAQPAPYRRELRAYGTVMDPRRLTELSNGYATAKTEVQAAQAKLDASRVAFARSQRLHRDQQNISTAQLQAAEATFRSDQAALAAAESQLRTVAATARQEWGPVLGQALVEGKPSVRRLVEREDVLVQVTLPPGVVTAAAPASAAVEVSSRSRVIVRYVSPATRTDPRIQGVSLLYTASADSALLPGMNLLALLPSDQPIKGSVVPRSAVVQWLGKNWIYLRTDSQTSARREIATDVSGPDGDYIVPEVPEGREIVTQGAQTLLSEELKSQIDVGGEG